MTEHAATPGRPPFAPAEPCARCLDLYQRGKIRGEAVMPLDRLKACNPLAREGWSGPVCHDCQAAETLIAMRPPILAKWAPPDFDPLQLTFVMARIVIANARQEELRLAGTGTRAFDFLRPDYPGTLDEHHHWLELNGIGRV